MGNRCFPSSHSPSHKAENGALFPDGRMCKMDPQKRP